MHSEGISYKMQERPDMPERASPPSNARDPTGQESRGTGVGNRVVLLTVSVVVLAGFLSAAATLWHTRNLSNSYDEALKAELEQKALTSAATVKSVLDAAGPDAVSVAQDMLSGGGEGPPNGGDSAKFLNEFLSFELWVPDPSASNGYRLLVAQDFSGGDAPPRSAEMTAGLLRSGGTGQVSAALDEQAHVMHGAMPIAFGDQGVAVAVVTLSAEEEFAFFARQRQVAIRNGALVSLGIAGFVSVIGGVLSYVVSRGLTDRRRAEAELREREERTRSIIETARDAFISMDAAGRITEWNAQAESIFGWSRSEAVGRTPGEVIIPPSLRDAHALGLQHFLNTGEGPVLNQRVEVTARHRDGHEFPVELSLWPVGSRDGWTFNAFLHDVTERKQAEEALRNSEERYRQAFEHVQDIVFQVASDGTILEVTPSVQRFGYTREELIGSPVLDLYEDGDRREAYLRALMEHGEVTDYELRLKAADGRVLDTAVSTRSVRSENGETVMFHGTLRDVTDRKRAEDALRESARRDPLTGLLNHGAIVGELEALLAGSADGAAHAVAVIDVDGLKAVNDTYGHLVGDAVLTAVASALARDGAVAGRYGGDEFAVVAPVADREGAERLRRDILSALDAASVTDPESGATVPVSASIGLAVYPDDAGTIEDLVKLADSEMYAAKRQRPAGRPVAATDEGGGRDRVAEMVGRVVPLLTSQGNLTETLRLVAHRVAVGSGYDAVNVDVFPESDALPAIRSAWADAPEDLVAAWLSVSRSRKSDPFAQTVARTGRGVVLRDLRTDERLSDGQRGVLLAAQLKSAAVVPLSQDDQLIGILSAASRQANAFTADDVQLLTAVARQVASTVRMSALVDELRAATERLDLAHTETVLLLAAAAEAHDHTTGVHLRGVRSLTEAIASQLGYGEDGAKELGLAAVLHDIGKIRVPGLILANPGPLDEPERALMQQHTAWGEEFLEGRPEFELAAGIARAHHERWDGSGYPDGLRGEAIPVGATIVSVADSFDAMTHDRPYRPRRTVDEAVQEILACSGKQFNPDVVKVLLGLYEGGALPRLDQDDARQAAA